MNARQAMKRVCLALARAIETGSVSIPGCFDARDAARIEAAKRKLTAEMVKRGGGLEKRRHHPRQMSLFEE